MDIEAFQQLPTSEIARLVRAAGPKVCVFPINGTRRWFMLEHANQVNGDFMTAYLRITWRRQVALYKLFFDHGIETLLTPVFGPDLLARGAEYRQLIMPGLSWFTTERELLDFYDAYGVRVRVYGDAHRCLLNTPYETVLEQFVEISKQTAAHQPYRLFFGVCAHDAAESVAEIGVRFYRKHGRLPTKQEIVTAYYGEPVAPVDFFIGFDRPTAFDMPLIATGNEDLYFTVAPSPYLDVKTLRTILYDHLYCRCVDEAYTELSPDTRHTLADFYQLNRHHVLGVGRRSPDSYFWYPLPQVKLPPQLAQGQAS